MKARHKKEIKALDGTGRKLIKQANKNKKKLAEAEARIAEVQYCCRSACIIHRIVLAATTLCCCFLSHHVLVSIHDPSSMLLQLGVLGFRLMFWVAYTVHIPCCDNSMLFLGSCFVCKSS